MPLPLLIGGAAALAGGALSAYDNYQNRKSANAAYDRIGELSDRVTAQNQADIDNLKALYGNTYGGSDVAYRQAVQDFADSPVYSGENYGFDGNVQDYMDPAVNQRVDAAMTAIDRQVGGNNLSSDYLRRVAGAQQAIASDEYSKAWDRMQGDRRQGLSEWQANEAQNVSDWERLTGQKKDLLGLYGNDRDSYIQGIEGTTSASLNNRTGGLQTQADVLSGKANTMQGQSGISSFLSPFAQFAGSYFGAQAR